MLLARQVLCKHAKHFCQCMLKSDHVCSVQLGDGTAMDRNTPSADQDVLTSVAAITAGAVHTCALTTSGAVRCWGRNGDGQASAVHARGAFLPARIEVWLCLLCTAWRWYSHESKHAISRCADKCGCNHYRTSAHVCTHNIGRCEMLGFEWSRSGKRCVQACGAFHL
jgi:hypothetical protein